MIPFIIQQILVGLWLLTTTSMAGWMNSPMSWSPDGEWLGYTAVVDPGRDDWEPGWLFDTTSWDDMARDAAAVGDRKSTARTPVYQIWVAHPNDEATVLVEEARWPLTAPSWSPRGKAIAFGRFVPQSMEPNQAGQRGRFEVVIQDAMKRKRVFWASQEFELDDQTRARFPQLALAWSPNGRFLAVSQPGREPSILIMGTDSAKVLATLEHATLPVWSPDGSQCAFIHTKNDSNSLCVVERQGQSFAPSRQFNDTSSIAATPGWSNDSQWIFAVVAKSTIRSRELALDRVSSRTGDAARVVSLLAEAGLRTGAVLGVAIDFDRDRERCFFAIDIAGRENELGVGVLRDQPHIPKRGHPIDGRLKIGAIAVSPDDRYLAIRFGSPGSLSPPALLDLATEQPTLIVSDDTSRRNWLKTLVGASRSLLLSGLPPVTADGHVGERPTLLPLPGELPVNEEIKRRLARIARLARPLCDPSFQPGQDPDRQRADLLAIEAHLFFAYLLDDFASAASDLDAIEPRITSLDDRLALLSLRAQILWSQGQHARARAIIEYLVAARGTGTKRIEETPAGLTVKVEASPKQVWGRYLTARAADGAATQSHSRLDLLNEINDIPLNNPFAAPEPLQIDNRAGNAPFAPFFRGGEALQDLRVADPDRPDVFQPGRPNPPADRPAPRFFP